MGWEYIVLRLTYTMAAGMFRWSIGVGLRRLTYTMAAGMFRWSIEKWDTGYRDGIHSATSDLHYGRWHVQVEH